MPAHFRPAPDSLPASERLRAIIRANVPVTLGGYLRRLACASIAAAALNGCAMSHFPPETELDSPACSDTGSWLAVHGLSPASEHESMSAWDGSGFVPQAFMLDEIGTRCATASNPDACNTEVAASSEIFGRFVVTTDGDLVARHATEEEVLALLGPIDTANEALLRAWHAGYSVGCGDRQRYGVRAVEDGFEVVATRMTMDCDPIEVRRYLLHVAPDGTLTVLEEEILESTPGVCIGRRPAGLAAKEDLANGDVLGKHFAEIARLEASAVDAFSLLAQELALHGAPAELVDRALAAAEDERRHAAEMGTLAQHFGAKPLSARVEPRASRPLFEVALENAVEGCVRETFGAWMGLHQAMSAKDPEIARAISRIAEDETRHAELSWSIAEWAEPHLSEDERRSIARARERAVLALRAEMSVEPAPELVERAGVPSAQASVALVDEMARTIWS